MCQKTEERLKAYKMNGIRIESLKDDVENYKLSLRKKNINELLRTRRANWDRREKEKDIEGKLSINLDDLEVSEEIKKAHLYSIGEYYDLHFSLLKSSNINEAKYGLGMLRMNVTDPKNAPFIMNYNTNAISDILSCIDKNISDYTICKEGMWVLLNIIFGMNNKELNGVILTPKGYRLWEKIFKYSNTELNEELLWLLNNSITEDHDTSLNLLSSNFFSNHLLPYFSTFAFNINTSEVDDNLVTVICTLLSNLLVQTYKEEEKVDKVLLNTELILINFSKTSNKKAYQSLLYGLCSGRHINNQSISEAINDTGLVVDILTKKKFFDDQYIVLFSTRFVGLYISEYDMPYEMCLLFLDLLIVNMNSLSGVRKTDALWSLSNLAVMPKMIKEILERGIIEMLIDICNKECNDISAEALYCIANVLFYSDFNQFANLIKMKIFDFVINILRNSTHEKSIHLSLQMIHYCLKYGEVLIQTLDYNYFKRKMINEGGLDLLIHIQNSEIGQSVRIDKEIREIIVTYFEEENNKEDIILNEYCDPNR